MKTAILFALGFILMAFSSCKKKEYTCECQGGLGGDGASIKIKDYSTSKALRNCEERLLVKEVSYDGFHNCIIK